MTNLIKFVGDKCENENIYSFVPDHQHSFHSAMLKTLFTWLTLTM
jgi:hypothetical protein